LGGFKPPQIDVISSTPKSWRLLFSFYFSFPTFSSPTFISILFFFSKAPKNSTWKRSHSVSLRRLRLWRNLLSSIPTHSVSLRRLPSPSSPPAELSEFDFNSQQLSENNTYLFNFSIRFPGSILLILYSEVWFLIFDLISTSQSIFEVHSSIIVLIDPDYVEIAKVCNYTDPDYVYLFLFL
jgi:hypothetical protein